jgi:hypothetical protein
VDERIAELAARLTALESPSNPRKPVPTPADEALATLPPVLSPKEAPTAKPSGDEALRLESAGQPPSQDTAAKVPVWVWVGLGVVLAAGGAGGWWFVRRDRTEIPDSSLGGITF